MMRKQLYFIILLLLSVQLAMAQTARYEYWLDNDYTSRTVVAGDVSEVMLDLDISSQKAGLHYFNFRTQSNTGEWGGLSRYLFFISPDETDGSMIQYEYWIDNDYEGRTKVSGATKDIALNLDISIMKHGIHYFNFRTQSKSGEWGGLSRYLFYFSPDETDESMAQYEYWIDNNYEGRTKVSGATTDIALNLDISSLKHGIHYFNFRTQSKSGEWGGLSRYLFYLKDSGFSELSHMEYWIDDRTNVMTQQVTDSIVMITVDISDLAEGDHIFYTQGVNSDGTRGMISAYEFSMSEKEIEFDGITLRVKGTGAFSTVHQVIGAEGAQTLAAIIWNKEEPLTDAMLEGISNPNLLVYVNDSTSAPTTVRNVIVNGIAKSIVLEDVTEGNGNFYCPQAFETEEISYTRDFQQTTEIGVSRAWESIALPFDVQTITHETAGELTPFGVNPRPGKPFWLRTLSDKGFTRATSIEANRPYIISVPNNPEQYKPEFNLEGKISFAASGTIVKETQPVVLALADSSVVLKPAFQRVERSNTVYALNVGQPRDSYAEGSVFEQNLRDIHPFEAYTTHQSDNNGNAPRFITIENPSDATGIEEMILTTVKTGKWYTLDGRQLQHEPTTKGVYIIDGKKVVIK